MSKNITKSLNKEKMLQRHLKSLVTNKAKAPIKGPSQGNIMDIAIHPILKIKVSRCGTKVFSMTRKVKCRGNSFRTVRGQQLKIQTHPRGYKQIRFSGKLYKVHRLVCETYLDNPENKPEVNHIDSDKGNNDLSNLEWCTGSENQIHRHRGKKRGVYPIKNSSKWFALLTRNNTQIRLGNFSNKEDAYNAVLDYLEEETGIREW